MTATARKPNATIDRELCELADLDPRSCSPTESWRDFCLVYAAISAEYFGGEGPPIPTGRSPAELAAGLLDSIEGQPIVAVEID